MLKYHCQPATVSATEFWNKDLLAASAETGGLPIEVMSVVPAPLKNDQKQVPLEANGMHKRKFQKVQPVDDSGRKPRETEGRLDWKERAKARQKPTEDVQKAPFSKYFKPRYASFPRGTRLTEERIKEMKIRYQLVCHGLSEALDELGTKKRRKKHNPILDLQQHKSTIVQLLYGVLERRESPRRAIG
ncbi:hypothetical protein CFE70_004980 [Pyrenophora teres f. teres 0-1]